MLQLIAVMTVGGQIPVVTVVDELLRRDGSLGLCGVSASGGVMNVDLFVVKQGGGDFLNWASSFKRRPMERIFIF